MTGPKARQVAVAVGEILLLTLDEDGDIRLVQAGAVVGGTYIPPQEVGTSFNELVEGLDTARNNLIKELGHDPFGGPEGGKVDSDTQEPR